MGKLSTARKLNLIARIVAQQIGRSRVGTATWRGISATANSFGRVLHQLWLEVTGFTFLALAGVGVLAGFREYVKYESGRSPGPGRLILAVCFAASFAWFGVSSFWRVRKRTNHQGH